MSGAIPATFGCVANICWPRGSLDSPSRSPSTAPVRRFLIGRGCCAARNAARGMRISSSAGIGADRAAGTGQCGPPVGESRPGRYTGPKTERRAPVGRSPPPNPGGGLRSNPNALPDARGARLAPPPRLGLCAAVQRRGTADSPFCGANGLASMRATSAWPPSLAR